MVLYLILTIVWLASSLIDIHVYPTNLRLTLSLCDTELTPDLFQNLLKLFSFLTCFASCWWALLTSYLLPVLVITSTHFWLALSLGDNLYLLMTRFESWWWPLHTFDLLWVLVITSTYFWFALSLGDNLYLLMTRFESWWWPLHTFDLLWVLVMTST